MALFRFCQSLWSAPLSPERATPLYGGRQAALFTFPRRSKSAEGRPSFLSRFRASPRALQLGDPSCSARRPCGSVLVFTMRFSPQRTSIIQCVALFVKYFDVKTIVDVEMYRLSGLCSCSVHAAPPHGGSRVACAGR